MYQKPYTCTEINVLLHFSDLRPLSLRYNKVRGPTFPEIQKQFNLRERSRSWHTILLSLSNSICMSLIDIWVCEVYDCRWLPKSFICKIFGLAVAKSLYCIILCQCHHPPPTYFLSCISHFLLVNLSKFGAGMLIKCCILPSRNIKSAKASGAPPQTHWGSSQRYPKPPGWM